MVHGGDNLVTNSQDIRRQVSDGENTDETVCSVHFIWVPCVQLTIVELRCLLPPGDGLVSADYSIDGGPAMRKALDALVNESLLLGNSSYFISPTLLDSPHNLSITVTDTGLGRNYAEDFFDILSPPSESDVNHPVIQ